ncbi:major capsid protein [Paracoccus solventivorans]|uniref:major capsid protein n=1 Tax=Paracoccus solventivorans TaxID=53463 RepID=UPI0038996D7E
MFINYRGVDSFSDAAAHGTKSALGIRSAEARVFPVGVPGAFQRAFAPGEGFESANTIGLPLYSMLIRDTQRDHWIRPEVYSYPLFIATRPEMLLMLTI